MASSFKLLRRLPAWVRSIARRKVLEQYRKSRNAPSALAPEVLDALAASASELDETWALRRQALAGCLEQTAPRAREIIEMRYLQERLPAQIAERLSWSVNAVHVALARVRKFLRDCTKRKLAGEET